MEVGVKWFQVDSNTPGSPTFRRILRKMGLEGQGALLNLWCWVAERGKLEPGRAVDENGRAFAVDELIDASHLPEDRFDELIEILLETEHIDGRAWHERRELCFPGMAKRCDEYTRRITGKRRENVPTKSGQDRDSVLVPVPVPVDVPGTGESGAVTLFPVQPTAKQEAAEVMSAWNTITTKPIPRCQTMTDKRTKQASARLKELGGMARMNEVISRIQASAFCRGETDRGQWVATIDWLLSSPDVPVKVLEGKYDNRATFTAPKPVVPGRVAASAGKYAHVGLKAVMS